MNPANQTRAAGFWRMFCTVTTLAMLAPCRADSSLDVWLASASLPEEARREVTTLWEERPLSFASFDKLFGHYANGDVALAELAAGLQPGRLPPAPSEVALNELPPVMASDAALRMAAQLHFLRRYDEGLAWLDACDPDLCSASQLYWYYRAVACHELVRMQEAAEAARTLLALEPAERRIEELARQVLRGAEEDKPGDLNHIARQMGDVLRRLRLGQSSEPNQELQQDVIAALDKLIEQVEEQRRQQQQQQQAGQMAQGDSSQPMQESRIAGMKGAGEVDDRDISPGGDWGSLPPAERERVTQQIIRDFPAHYRDVIEDYFRSLAKDSPAEEDGR